MWTSAVSQLLTIVNRSGSRKLVLVLIAVSLVVAIGPRIYGLIGGTEASRTEPFRWGSEQSLMIVFRGGKAGEIGCTITPDAGETRKLETQGSFPGRDVTGEFQSKWVRAWFDGEATVVCRDADVFTGWAGYVAQSWPMGPGLVVLMWIIGLYVRHRLFIRWLKHNRPELV